MEYAVDVVAKVPLNGFPQKIHIRSIDPENPVILFLHGGPGIPNRHFVMEQCSDLCDQYTIVAWDQRGTGGSYRGVDPATLTLDQLVSDANALVEYLCVLLDREKIYLLGGSWGSELGTVLAFRHPERIAGYIGYGQVVDGARNEELSYAYTLEKAREANDAKAIAILERVGPPVNGQYTPVFDGLMEQRKLMKKYGGHTVKKQTYFQGTVAPILLSREYTLEDKVGIQKGYQLCLETMWPSVMGVNFIADGHKFETPYYIFQGRHDKNTPSALVEEYYSVIEAPKKELVWFENSAHGPLDEEGALFKRLLRERFV